MKEMIVMIFVNNKIAVKIVNSLITLRCFLFFLCNLFCEFLKVSIDEAEVFSSCLSKLLWSGKVVIFIK